MPKSSEQTFEQSLRRLEEIVQRLEGNAVALEESLALYEEGKDLIEYCLKKLDAAQQKIQLLSPEEEA